ncbi:cyclophilin-like fold protein [uncultured Ruminococcus sp.]|uniref:cyclophilin-like fold protein n=1 Tax=uncultured Ruminococcus sp. TaxID=165186 RepID=UPI00292F4383|nr:cyclophilin-like fold protein [uncultured Ruminococcus sp.]
MKKTILLSLIGLMMILSACGNGQGEPKATLPTDQPPTAVEATEQSAPETETVARPSAEDHTREERDTELEMTIGDTPVTVEWEDNETVEALKEAVKTEPLTVQMSMYGGFEQVGSLNMTLPRNDVQTTTSAGDIVLYAGDQLVVFYGSNSWAYTRLGHVSDKTQQELTELLSNGDVTVTLI